MKEDFIKPMLVLTLICLVVSGALAFTNSVTEPMITEAAVARTEAAMFEVMPLAEGFEQVTIDELPDSVREVHKSINNVGYIFILNTTGYGGDIVLLCAIGVDGRIIRCKTLEHSETKGLGSRVAEKQFEDQFAGANGKLEGVETITGATISSSAYISAVKDALSVIFFGTDVAGG